MPKKRKLKFTGGMAQLTGPGHPMLVASVKPQGSGWQIKLVHLSSERLGQKHPLTVPAEAPHDGAIGSLFQACGLDVGPQAEIDPCEAEGKIVSAVFYSSTNGTSGIIGFEPCQKENSREPNA